MRLLAPIVRGEGGLEHVVDAEIRRRILAMPGPPARERVAFEAIAEVEFLSPAIADELFGERDIDAEGMVLVRGPDRAQQLQGRGREFIEGLDLQGARLVCFYAQRYGASSRAIAEICSDVWPWAHWYPRYNQLIGTALVRASAYRIAIARGEQPTF